jgi:REP element-mobilizing transposase RayT
MAGTFSQIYIQIVFAVQGRQNLLQKEWRDEVFKYMAGIIRNKGQKPIIVNGVEDHVHVFVGLRPAMALSDLVRDIKTIPRISSMTMRGSKAGSTGRRDMARFHTVIRKLEMCMVTF